MSKYIKKKSSQPTETNLNHKAFSFARKTTRKKEFPNENKVKS